METREAIADAQMCSPQLVPCRGGRSRRTASRLAQVACALGLLAAPATAVSAETSASKEQFLKSYAPMAARIQEFYSAVTISAVDDKVNFDAYEDSGGRRTDFVVFYANGESYRVDRSEGASESAASDKDVVGMVVTRKRCFRVHRDASAEKFALDRVDADYPAHLQSMRARNLLVAAPYGFLDSAILDFIKLPDVRLLTMTEGMDGGQTIVEVRFAYDMVFSEGRKKPLKVTKYGYFRFLKDRCWALRAYYYGEKPSWTDPNPKGLRALIEYDGDRDGVPLLKRAEYWSEFEASRGRRTDIQTYTVKDIKIGPADEAEFALSAYGIPEIGEEGGGRMALWYFAAGGILLIVLFILVWRTRRKQGA